MRPSSTALVLAAALAAASLPVHAEYFLDAAQKGELIARGEITGRDSARYNVWIVPGYVGPGQDVADGWRAAGEDLGDYGDGDFYRRIGRHSRDGFRFGHRDLLRDFALEGTGRTWRESFTTAQGRVDKRVFGWWFAYPWALIEATGVSALRLGIGVPGGIAVSAGSVTLWPVAEATFPLWRAGYHAGVQGTALPLVAASWNTVVAPPLALLGEQPSPERADGFWMKRMDPLASDAVLAAASAELTRWRNAQLAAEPARAVRRAADDKQRLIAEQRREVLQRFDAAEARTRNEEQAALRDLLQAALAAPGAPDRAQLQALQARYGREPLLQALAGGGLDAAAAQELLEQWLGQPAPSPAPTRADDARTDPLRRSLELMESPAGK